MSAEQQAREQLQARIAAARERFGRPFAHEPGTDWTPRATPVLTDWLSKRAEEKRA